MNEIKIYIKGTTGFKPAVKEKLEDATEYKVRNINTDNIMVLMPDGVQLYDLRTSIGEDVVTTYDLQFLTSMDTHDSLESSKGRRFDSPVKMSIWTSEHSNIKTREPQIPQHDPGPPVF